MTEKQFIEIAKQDYPDRKRINYTTDEQYKAEQIRLKDKRASYIKGLKKGYRLYQEEMYQRLEEVIHKRPCDYLKEMWPEINFEAVVKESMKDSAASRYASLATEAASSDDLENEIQRYIEKMGFGHGGWVDGLSDEHLKKLARHFANWRLGQYMQRFAILKKKMEEASKKWVIVVSDGQLSKDALEGYIERDLGGQLVIGRSNAPSGDEFMLMPSTMFSDVKCGEKYQAKILIIKQDKQ